jgi:glycosyltransferase involved in cell wall biosynthesis
MKIWYISKYAVTPDLGKPTRQFFLSKYFVRSGHNVTLISSVSSGVSVKPLFKSNIYKQSIEGVKHILINGPLVQFGFSIKRIYSWILFEVRLFLYAKRLKNEKPDVIIVSSLSLLTFLTGIYLKKKYAAKLIIEVRDIWPLTIIELGEVSKNNLFIKLLSLIEKSGYKNADGIVGTMPLLNIHISKVIASPFKFKCIPMGFDPEYYSKTGFEDLPLNVKKILQEISQKKFIVCYAGTLGRANLVDDMIKAAKLLYETNNNIHFIFLGDGPLKKNIVDASKEFYNIIFYSAIEKKFVINILKQCDLLINCWKDEPIYRYGVSPNKWIDYMLSGKPILTAYGGYQSLINEANCGFFIPPNQPEELANKIKEISLMNKTQLYAMGQRGLDYIFENRTYARLAEEYIDFIVSV